MSVNNINGFSSVSIVDIAQKMKPKSPENTKVSDSFGDYVKGVNQDQTEANTNIVDLLSGKNKDINSVVASVARSDMSFKMLVGVRNKLVTAYKEVMKMQV